MREPSYLLRLYTARCRANMGGTTEARTFRPSHGDNPGVETEGFFVAWIMVEIRASQFLRGG